MRARARGRGHLVPLLAGLFLSPGLLERSVFAQAPEGGSAASVQDSTRTVDVTIVEGGDDAGLLMDTIRELVGRLGLGVTPHRVAASEGQSVSSPPAGLSVWVNLGSRYEVMTIVRNGPTEVRRKIPRDASPAIVREEIGEAVRSAVESQLLTDATPSAPVPPSAPPAPASAGPVVVEAPSAPAASSHGLALDVTTVAGAGAIASNTGPVAHVGGGLVVASRREWRPSLSMTAEYVAPFDAVASNGVNASTSFVSLRAVAAVEVLHRSWIGVDVGAGGGVDIITVDASVASPSSAGRTFTPEGDVPTHVDPVLTARGTAYFALAPGVTFTLVAGSDVDLKSLHYAFNGVQSGDVLVPWRLRPVVLAGFTFTALGSGLFATRAP
jgi:hypothetical protein